MARHFDERHGFGPRSFAGVASTETLLALRETPLERRDGLSYKNVERFTWMRMLQPLRLPYRPEWEWKDRPEWRKEFDSRAAGIYGLVLRLGIE